MKNSISQERYETNWEMLAAINPLAAYRLEFVWDDQELSLCETDKGEPNLCKSRYGITNYYHSQTGALEEAQVELKEEILNQADVIYLYGLGLGYFYDALLPWLKEDANRHVVFLEDDLEVIYYFLHTERATQLLQDSQTTFFYFHEYSQSYERFYQLHLCAANRRIQFLTLPFYAAKRELTAFTLCYNTLHDASLMSNLYNEYLSGQSGFLANFYRNFLLMHQSTYAANGLFGRFKNIPAIICGAGPSMQKNLPLLKSLKDRALIFAGGSSLNVLNHAGIIPHFGLGVDPNSEQYHRLLTNDTFHLPYLFRPRVSNEAFQLMQGPKLYVPGSVNRLAAWFEERLGLPGETIDEGHNVINLCTEIAYRMGCNPIIYVGMDLAFTEVQSYATGINVHPLWVELSQPYSHAPKEQVKRRDIYGNPILTKWDWIAESSWISHFSSRDPSLKMINATEGGLGFFFVPNYSLAEVEKHFLQQPYALDHWIHSVIQNSKLPLKQATIFNLVNEMKTSLERCIVILKQVIDEKSKQLESGEPVEKLTFYSTHTILQESELMAEVGYQHFLNSLENAFHFFQEAQQNIYHHSASLFSNQLECYRFLLFVAELNIQLMTQAVHQFIASPPPLSFTHEKRLFTPSPGEEYHYNEGHLQISDPALGISINDRVAFNPLTDRRVLYYPTGELLGEMHYFQNQLHGPSRFYHPSGSIMAESWYFQGNCAGTSLQYYPSGTLYSIRRFTQHLPTGKHEYFFENGAPHVVLHYQNGVLHGEVQIFTPTGKLLREIQYSQGKRHGQEKMWDNNGQLLMECTYQEGVPIGQARQWNPRGWLFKEVSFNHFPHDFDLSIWDAEGKKIQFFEHGIEDFAAFYEETQKQTAALDEALKAILEKLDPVMQEKLKCSPEEAEVQFAAIKQSLEEMQKWKKELDAMGMDNMKKTEEAKRQQKEQRKDADGRKDPKSI